jgi:hypothetical protein
MIKDNKTAHNNLKNAIMVEICKVYYPKCWVTGRSVGTFTPYKGKIPVHIGTKGEADIYALIRGISFFIEVKTGEGRLSAYQKGFQQVCEKAGGVYLLARDIDVVMADISKHISQRHPQ